MVLEYEQREAAHRAVAHSAAAKAAAARPPGAAAKDSTLAAGPGAGWRKGSS